VPRGTFNPRLHQEEGVVTTARSSSASVKAEFPVNARRRMVVSASVQRAC
jgi:hypothetical protein